MIYDVHAHCIPAGLVEWIEQRGAAIGVGLNRSDDQISVSFADRYHTAPLRSELTERNLRLETMDRTGVDVQVLASWIDLTG